MSRVALCLPITSRGSTSDGLLNRMRSFRTPQNCTLFVGTDEGDTAAEHAAEELKQTCPDAVVVQGAGRRNGRLLDVYCTLMEAALEREEMQYFVMWGDDVVLDSCPTAFHETISTTFAQLPCGKPFGCVVLSDTSSPGFPTYPVVARCHFEVFGRFVPEDFINQDADPFIYETYRRFGAAKWVRSVVVKNCIGGALGKARYTEVHVDWKNKILDNATEAVAAYLAKYPSSGFKRTFTIDTVTPTFRGDVDALLKITKLRGRHDELTLHHIIVDNPGLGGEKIGAIRDLEKQDALVRVRVLPTNSGASEARNRGLDESAADYILFIDDDVQVPPTLLARYESALIDGCEAGTPTRCGYVGPTVFNPPATAYEKAIALSGITYFWDAACRMPTPPWGVTANLLLRHTPARFKTYVKTGGGEDIALCLDTAQHTGLPLGAAPGAQAEHPWWPDGVFRFFRWTQGDGKLVDDYPSHTYRTLPNAQEVGACLALAAVASLASCNVAWCTVFLSWAAWVVLAELLDDLFCFSMVATPGPAFVLASFIRSMMEYGHLWVHLKRGRVKNICRRFDWFCDTLPGDVGFKQALSGLKFVVFAAVPVVGHLSLTGLLVVWGARAVWRKY